MVEDVRYSHFTRLKFDRPEPAVLRVKLSNGKMNSADKAMHAELAEIWSIIDKDPTVNAVILTGDGNTFSAGGDFKMIEEMVVDFEERARAWKESRDIVYGIINCSKPIVSAMRGVAVGAGLVCGLLADITIASRDCRMVDGHTRLGVAAGDHAAIIWPLLCGMAKSKMYLLLCDPVSGEDAERMGLISMCVDDADLDARAEDIAGRLAHGSQSAIRWTKYSLNNWLRQAGPIFDASLALEYMGLVGPDLQEGLHSHLEKRKPVFAPSSTL
ncbi:MAG: enoyl-CoA hydratase/isomerase family protein [Sphingobium sp.]|nr:enoyl-CoA hydratase/isomerase family protein [Sphingobium sp.]MCI1270773.1 enoyl-CoA hydratase/isomerase family protein [Sphingobium sp.]MCI1756385.1 enoyl-CoA hydratase/isomerase family protein [Sphingobium sp.]MCI2051920.1 enoyl-CoA hydratase/isomerase family protein [Sphingobium sp.]